MMRSGEAKPNVGDDDDERLSHSVITRSRVMVIHVKSAAERRR